jgi:plasmid stabilization system protein ParE
MRIRYTKRAFLDRESIFDYLDERSPQGARNVQRAVAQAIRSLELYPQLGRITAVAEVRELAVPRYPYKVYYRIDGDEIRILHIRDARRRPWLER